MQRVLDAQNSAEPSQYVRKRCCYTWDKEVRCQYDHLESRWFRTSCIDMYPFLVSDPSVELCSPPKTMLAHNIPCSSLRIPDILRVCLPFQSIVSSFVIFCVFPAHLANSNTTQQHLEATLFFETPPPTLPNLPNDSTEKYRPNLIAEGDTGFLDKGTAVSKEARTTHDNKDLTVITILLSIIRGRITTLF